LDAKAYKPPINRRSCIKLDLNENYSVLDEKLLEKMRKFDAFTTSSYPEYQELTPLLAKYASVPEGCLSLTNGSDHGIQLLLDLFFEKGDKVIIPSPIFFVYYHFLKIKEVTIKDVLYTEENGQYKFPFEETLKALDAGVKGLILCNPNNPLGNSIPENELVELIKKTNDLDIPIIVDEAYFEYSNVNATKHLSEYKNLVILRTFSKAFGMSGLRLGYVIADQEIINELEKLRLAWSVNHFAVHAGITVLGEVQYFKKKIQEQKRIKDELYNLLSTHGIQCYKTDTNFLICKHPNYSDLVSHFNDNGILVNDVSHYPYSGDLLKNAFRINTPSEEDLNTLKKMTF
jgi:histidinol-phosphate aminotransferase